MTASVRRALSGPQLARLLSQWASGRTRPLAQNLAECIRALLLDGRVSAQVRMPSERELATALALSRTTVTAAYGLLRDSGYLDSRRGSGSWTVLPPGGRVDAYGLWSPLAEGARDADRTIDLALAALPAPPALLDAVDRASFELPRYAAGLGYHPLGLTRLREAVAAHYQRRGLPTTADQIIITNGAQHALTLVLSLLVAPGEAVLVESPSYPNALDAVRRSRARVVPCGMTRTGWDADLLESAIHQTGPRLAYLIADFHNPTGRLMNADTRQRVATAAHRFGVDVLVDETFADLALDEDRPPPPLAAFDRHGRVLTSGTMSKAFWGGLRVGWIRAAPPLVVRLAAARASGDLASPVLEQLVAAELLDLAEDVLAERRALLRTRRRALAEAVARELPDWRFDLPTGGIALWAELPRPVSSALCRAARAHRVRMAPGPRFGTDGTLERFLRLPFTLPPEELAESARRLRRASAELDGPSSGSASSPLVT